MHKVCQILFAFTNQCPSLQLHSKCFTFHTLAPNIAILFTAIPQHIFSPSGYTALLKTLHI